MNDELLIPYAPILVESTRSIGYSFEAALADIIDNSISANAKEIYVNFMSTDSAWLCVLDNGCGMSKDELRTAMKYGSKSSLERRNDTDLGRFGLGLKTASLSQCRCLTVISKKSGVVSAARWDLDHVISCENWSLLWLDYPDIESLPGVDWLETQVDGTVVLWQVFDRLMLSSDNSQKVFDEKIELTREHVALVFHRFLGDESAQRRVRIFFNGDIVVPVDPFLSNHPATQPLTEQIIRIGSEQIRVKPYILPFSSKLSAKDIKNIGGKEDLRQRQGFYVYRNKRLIIWGTWFRLLKQYELNKLARVRVDIPNSLDSMWEIDVKKSTASLPNIIKKSLISIVESSVGRSERVYRYRGRDVRNDDLEHIWNKIDCRGKFQYVINRDLPLYKALESRQDDEGALILEALLKIVEDAFPYSAVYYDLAKSENCVSAGNLDESEVYDVAVRMIKQLRDNGEEISQFLAKLDKLDFFSRYPAVVLRIREDYKND